MNKKQLLGTIGELIVNEAKRNINAQGIETDSDVLLRNSLTYRIEDDTVIVGTNLYYGVWREYGTGRFAVHGDGREPWWLYVTDPTTLPLEPYTPSTQPVRHVMQAYAIMYSMNEKFEAEGSPKRAHVSEGNPARPFLVPALDANKSIIKKLIYNAFKENK